ncbi:MAE_28990/MAE_18760 family HEPN-like nuclease [Methylosinus sp. LW4]|uniref:MAE_28990/MAE_18760 family HEPN-like nuclease n=1 Tax=Methylosinus sp. LW4 TaxID=136993 RepID=UPI0018DEE4DA
MASKQLISTIDGELCWREGELAIAKLHLHKSLIDRMAFAYSYRCIVMLTYAHYEAFSKRIIAQAMQDIFTSGIRWSECCDSIIVNLFANRLRQNLSSLSNKELSACAIKSLCLVDDLPPPDASMILDCGNLNNQNFDWALGCVGVDPTKFSYARRDIGRIVALRHDCAHGEQLTFDTTKSNADLAADIFQLQSSIILLMHALAVEIIDLFERSGYKRVP